MTNLTDHDAQIKLCAKNGLIYRRPSFAELANDVTDNDINIALTEHHNDQLVRFREWNEIEKIRIQSPQPVRSLHYNVKEFSSPVYVQEKCDGFRMVWTGQEFRLRSRKKNTLGKIVNVPDHWKLGMPNVRLDGELWLGREKNNKHVGGLLRRKGDAAEHWKKAAFVVFDIINETIVYDERYMQLQYLPLPDHCMLSPTWLTRTPGKLVEHWQRVKSQGGEGIIIREQFGMYRAGWDRSDCVYRMV